MGPVTEQDQNLMVSDLMIPNSADWNIHEIRRRIPVYESYIRKIVPSESLLEDEICWLIEKSGQYSIKSGYALAKIHNGNIQDSFNWKKLVWNVQCSPKLRHFLWKVKSNALAVGETLLKRGIQVDGKCKRCGEAESILHVMFACPTAQKVWALAPAMNLPTTNLSDNGGAFKSQCKYDQLTSIRSIHSPVSMDPLGVVDK